jgi:DNA-binding beta-propeller fold protein YncE
VLIWSSLPTTSGTEADVILGQPTDDVGLPNAGGPAAASTFRSPHGLAVNDDQLFVADRDNHRVLVFDDFSSLSGFDDATLVLGQGNFVANEPNRGQIVPTRESLSSPHDVLVGGGRLYIADTANHRVVIYNGVPVGSGQAPDGLLGQGDFNSRSVAPASPNTLVEPSGLAMDPAAARLAVADTGHHRVLLYDVLFAEPGEPRAAKWVLGQTGLSGGAENQGLETAGPQTLSGPRGLFDNGYELYAADQGNDRLLGYR